MVLCEGRVEAKVGDQVLADRKLGRELLIQLL